MQTQKVAAKRNDRRIPQGEFRKARLPTFDGTDKVGQEAEAWLLGMERYFKIQEYSKKEKARITIFSLNGRALIWWEHLLEVKGIKDKYLKEKYLSAQYYDNKREKFRKLKLGQKSMEEHV